MFNILTDIVCTDYVLAYYLSIIKIILTILQVAVPIVFLLSLAISFVQMVVKGEDKKITQGIGKKIIAVLICLLLPWIVETVLNLIEVKDVDTSTKYTLGSCWAQAEELRQEIDNDSDEAVDKDNDKTNLSPNTSSLNGSNGKDENSTQENNGNNSNNSSSSDSSTQTNSSSQFIFIGDSRTHGMQAAVGQNKDIWSCKDGKGLAWMKSTGVPDIESKVNKQSIIIILMGVNDVRGANMSQLSSNYASYLNNKASTWSTKGAKVYFISVLPTKGAQDSLNTDIDSFNKALKPKLSRNVHYMDVNSYMKKNGFKSSDGLHYTGDTYKDIYNYIKSHV